MRSYQVFAAMTPEHSIDVMRGLAEKAPQFYKQALVATSASLKARPVYLQRQPFDKQAQAVRRALARVAANAFAEEALAVYFLECRKDLLIDWLDALGIEHEDGILKQDAPPAPNAVQLERAHDAFRAADDDPDRLLLLKAFAAQSAIDWPALEVLISA